MNRLGRILKEARAGQSRVQFARMLGLSYTFVRAMEHGSRFPSDKVLLDIAKRLGIESGMMILAAYADRSPTLVEALEVRGVSLPAEDPEILAREAEAEPAAALPTEPMPGFTNPEQTPTSHFGNS